MRGGVTKSGMLSQLPVMLSKAKHLMFAILTSFTLTSCYITQQAWHQASLLNKRKPVSDVVSDPGVSQSTKEKLRFTKTVLAYAEREGLAVDDSYTQYIELNGPAVSYLVQAAKPDEFKLKTWWFPFVGTVPYLGFFDPKDRDEYAKVLEKEGFEVHKGAAAAFSSLGWFSDPVYSSMLSDDDFELAHLYFHELTHKTAWIAGSVEFNENFAEFIGETLTERFFIESNRLDELKRFHTQRRDRERFKTWLKELRTSLERYFAEHKQEPPETFIKNKKELIARHVAQRPSFEAFNFVGEKPWNTPRILAASLYSPDTETFRKAYACSKAKRLGDFARLVKKTLESADNPEEELAFFCNRMSESITD